MTGTLYAREESPYWIDTLFAGENPERPRFEQLIHQHWAEIAVEKKLQRLNVSWEAYGKLAVGGFLLMCTLRGLPLEGEMLGYFLCVVMPQPHYKHVIAAVEDSHFILPEYRRQGAGKALFTTMERAARRKGAALLRVRTKKHSDNGDFLKSAGYTHIEDVYQKVL